MNKISSVLLKKVQGVGDRASSFVNKDSEIQVSLPEREEVLLTEPEEEWDQGETQAPVNEDYSRNGAAG